MVRVVDSDGGAGGLVPQQNDVVRSSIFLDSNFNGLYGFVAVKREVRPVSRDKCLSLVF